MLELNETRVVKIHIHILDAQALLLHGDGIVLLRLDGRCLQNWRHQKTILFNLKLCFYILRCFGHCYNMPKKRKRIKFMELFVTDQLWQPIFTGCA